MIGILIGDARRAADLRERMQTDATRDWELQNPKVAAFDSVKIAVFTPLTRLNYWR